MMNSSSGGDTTAPPASVRAVPVTVKYPSVTPLLYIPGTNSPQGNVNNVKVIPTGSIGLPRATPIRVTPVSTSHNASFLSQNSNRSLLSKPATPLVASNKSNQKIVMGNASGVLRSVPATVFMGGGAQKKQIITLGNVGNQVSLLDSKTYNKYVGTLIKNKKMDGTPEGANTDLMLVTAPNSTGMTSATTYMVSKTSKQLPQGTYTTQLPGPQGKRVQLLLTTDGTLQPKSSLSTVQSSPGSKEEVILSNRTQSSVLKSGDDDYLPDLSPLPKLDEQRTNKPNKYFLPISQTVTGYKNAQSPVLVPVTKKGDETLPRMQGTSLGQIVSSNPSGSVTNFQISNGQIVSEKISKPRMLSLLYDDCEAKPDSPSEAAVDKNNEDEDTGENQLEITEMPIINEPIQKPEPVVVKNRRKQALAVKDDRIRLAVPISDATDAAEAKLTDDEVTRYFQDDKKDSGGEDKPEDVDKTASGSKLEEEMDRFDPIKYLEWSDNVGSLPLSDLKFKLNEFGLIEMIDEDADEGKISSKSSVVSDLDKSDSRRKKTKGRSSDEILCCLSCGTYGMSGEFVSSRFCSSACSKVHADEKALSVKRLQERQEKKTKLKQQKFFLMQQKAKLEALGLHEAKVTIEEKLKKLRMERELMKTNNVDSDAESGSGIPGNADRSTRSASSSSKSKNAPPTLFKDPFPSNKNNFKVGMKLEGIDPIHPSLFCVLSVSAVRGYRIKLHFDGYPDCHDFWVSANSSDIFHAGWCERTNHKLSAPKGYGEKSFNWGNYLRMTRTVAAPKSCFVNNQEKNIIPSGFRVGMKLEAVDKKNSSLVCVATISDVLDNRILVHFDSWDDIYDYWVDYTSPYIHPVGWCKENGHQLTPPNDYKSASAFSWDVYLRETKSLPAPARAFKPRTTTEFRRGMKIECVDKRNQVLVRVATVIDVVAQQLKIKFDGWPDQYAYWVDDDSPDIHPVGWCQKTGHPLEPPPSEEDIKNTSVCPTPGCRGKGHVKALYPIHHTALSCPYSSVNYLRDDHIPDRFCSKREYYEVKETSLSKGTKPRPGVPRKIRNDDPNSPTPKPEERRGRKRKAENRPPPAKKKVRSSSGAEENNDPSTENEPPLWAKNNWDISETVASIGSNPLSWTPSQVAIFVENINNSVEKGKLFSEHQIDVGRV